MVRLFIVQPHAEREDYYAACHRTPTARHKKIRDRVSRRHTRAAQPLRPTDNDYSTIQRQN
jgi:hypothetical protein